MNLKEKKKILSEKLKEERNRILAKNPNFDFYDYELAIEFLKTGIVPEDFKDTTVHYEIADACINDFKMIFNDYTT